MIKALALALFGWKRTPERFVPKYADYIQLWLKENGVSAADRLPVTCRVALSQLAYLRAANMNLSQKPRFRNYVFELEKIAAMVANALAEGEITDERVRSILLFHRVLNHEPTSQQVNRTSQPKHGEDQRAKRMK